MLEINKLYLGNCLDYYSKIDDGSIDLICIDPPYEINYNNEKWDKENSFDWKLLAKQYYRMLKLTGNLIIFQGWSNVSRIKEIFENNFYLQNWIIWDRIKGRGAKRNVVSTREDILWFIKDRKNYIFNKIYSNIPKKTGGMGKKNNQNNRALSNVWTDISPLVPWSSEYVDHPTQKPLQLMKRIITIWSNENDIILDGFAGSGSTIIAATSLNRNFIGIEMDKKYFNIMKQRLYNENPLQNFNLIKGN